MTKIESLFIYLLIYLCWLVKKGYKMWRIVLLAKASALTLALATSHFAELVSDQVLSDSDANLQS